MVTFFDTKRTNTEIIDGVSRGDTDCINEFHGRFGQRIDNLVWSLLGADKDRNDMVQIIFINILSSIHTVRDADRLHHWVDSVIFRTVRKELRKRAYRNTVIPQSNILSEFEKKQDNESALVALRFYQMIDTLDTDERMIFVLRFMENHTLVELAEISGWSASTVKRRIQSAVQKFKDLALNDSVLASCIGEANVGS